MGGLGYMLYNYVFYLYGAAFNSMFLAYVALFALSAYAFLTSLPRADAVAIARNFGSGTPARTIASWMAFFAVLLGGLWVALSLSYVFTGKVPPQITQTGHPTGVVFASDLAFLVPALLVAASLLWRRMAWGFVLSTILMFKATTYGLALAIMTAFSVAGGGGPDPFLPLWLFLASGCAVSLAALLRNVRAEAEEGINGNI